MAKSRAAIASRKEMLFEFIKKQLNGNGLKAVLIRGGVGSIAVKILSTALSLLMAMLLARTLGAEGYGVYAFVLAVVTVLSIPAQAGLPTIVVRETAKADASENWPLMRGVWRWSTKVAALISACLATVLVFYLLHSEGGVGKNEETTFYAGIALIPLMALANIRGAALRGLRRVVLGQLPEGVARTGLLSLFLLMSIIWFDEGVTPSEAMWMHCISALSAFLLGAYLLSHFRPLGVKNEKSFLFLGSEWRRSLVPLSLISGASVINAQADIIMLGWFRSDEEVGVYRVVASSVLVINFGRHAITSVVSPYFAQLYAKGNTERLQAIVSKSAQAMFLMAAPIFLIFGVAGEELLALIFGEEFSVGYRALMIMSVGFFVSVCMGSVGALLNMSGNERYTAIGAWMSASVNIVLNLALIPKWGIEGAAFAMMVSMVISSLFLWWASVRTVGIHSGIFGNLFK